LTQDHIVCTAEVDFTTDDSEPVTRDNIVEALKTQMHDIGPDDFQFVKVQNRRISVPLVAKDYKWHLKHIKNLCGQGKLYIRLLRQSDSSSTEGTADDETSASASRNDAPVNTNVSNKQSTFGTSKFKVVQHCNTFWKTE